MMAIAGLRYLSISTFDRASASSMQRGDGGLFQEARKEAAHLRGRSRVPQAELHDHVEGVLLHGLGAARQVVAASPGGVGPGLTPEGAHPDLDALGDLALQLLGAEAKVPVDVEADLGARVGVGEVVVVEELLVDALQVGQARGGQGGHLGHELLLAGVSLRGEDLRGVGAFGVVVEVGGGMSEGRGQQ